MLEKVKELLHKAESFEIKTKESLEAFRLDFIGKKSKVTDLFSDFRNVPNEQKKAFGQELNKLKTAVEEKFKSKQ